MLVALIEAVERYNASPELQQRAKDEIAKYDRNMRARRIWEEDEDESEVGVVAQVECERASACW